MKINKAGVRVSDMDMIDFFAGMAMASIIKYGLKDIQPDEQGKTISEIVANRAYLYANAMILERYK